MLKWFQDNNLNPEKEQELQALWQEAGEVPAAEQAHNSERIFSRIKAQIQEPQQPEQDADAATRFLQPQQSHFWLKAAAVLLPLCLIWAIIQFASQDKAAAAVYVSVSAAPGVKKKINLPDGSVITLNAGSQVSFRENFAADKREIVLRGEAFFEVAKDSLRPFIVHTGNISTQALGTSFNINYNLYDTAITVALATGVVRVDRQGEHEQRQVAQLVPGQQLAYSRVSQHHAVAPFDRKEVLGWQRGILYFKQANMDQIIRKLENWYGVDIKVDARGTHGGAWNYTGEYENETLDKVLEGIGFVKGFTYRQTGKKVRIVFN